MIYARLENFYINSQRRVRKISTTYTNIDNILTFIITYIDKFTFVYNRFHLTEIREGGKFRNAILFGESLVVDLNEVDAERVSVIIYLF